MKKKKQTSPWVLGIAIFTMLFGAGNVVFPLLIGKSVGNQVPFAVLGFILTAVVVPLLGLISAMLFEGDYKKYLATTGTIPGIIITFVCMVLMGLFAAPRCIALSYETMQWYAPNLNLLVYSIVISMLIFVLTLRKSKVVDILGKYLGPVKITLLLAIIALGALFPHKPLSTGFLPMQSFMKGFLDGYFTMDLLGTVFFSNLVYTTIRKQMREIDEASSMQLVVHGLKAGVIGGTLLGAVYIGFCIIAAMYGPLVTGSSEAQLLSALATTILGSGAGIIANISVAIAGLATAIALTTVFANYLQKDIFNSKITYNQALATTVIAEFVMTNLGFMGIIKVMEPILNLCYPALIVLALANTIQALWGFRYTQLAVFTTLAITAIIQYGSYIITF